MSIFEDYLESAVSDRPHSNIDRFILEDKMDKDPLSGLVQETQYSMSVPRTPHPEDALPIGAGVKLFRGVPKWFRKQMVKGGKHLSPPTDRHLYGVFASKSKEAAEYFAKRGSKGQG